MRRALRSALFLQPAVAALVLSLPHPAYADAQDTLNFIASASLKHDDNIFRRPGATDSDRIMMTSLGFKVDKAYSQQRLQFSGTLTDNRYDRFSNLDFISKNYQAAWLWHFTPRLSGSVKADRSQVLNDFADFRTGTTRNIRTTENRLLDFDWWAHGSWHLVGGVTENRQENSQTFTADASSTLVSAQAGVSYVAESGNSLRLLARSGKGENPGRTPDPVAQLDNRFEEKATEATVNYTLSGKSALTGRLARVERNHEHFPARDYSGTTGRLDYTWKPLGKLQVGIAAGRDIASFQEAGNSYYVNDILSIAPAWQVTAKVAARLRLDRSQRDYRGAVVPGAPSREERLRTVAVSADWAVLHNLSLSATLQRDRRASSLAGFDFKATAATLSAQLSF